MNIIEATEILSNHVTILKKSNYSDLRKYLRSDELSTREFTGRTGTNYRIDIHASWVDKKDGNLRIRTSIDSDYFSYFFPLSEEFILTRYSGFVGNKKTVPTTKFRIPRWIFNAVASARDYDFTLRNVANLLFVITMVIGSLIGIGYVSSRFTPHGEGEEYVYGNGARLALYVPIYSFRKEYSRWPTNAGELQDFITKNNMDINLKPYRTLVFQTNKDGSLSVTYTFKALKGIENGSFELTGP